MNNNPTTPATYDGQLAERAAELLPGIGTAERLELLAAMDEGEMSACLAFIASHNPQVFDHSIVRDRKLAVELQERLDAADADEDLEPYCSVCGAKAGVFLKHGDGYLHHRGEGTAASPVELFDAGHEPVIAWRMAGAR